MHFDRYRAVRLVLILGASLAAGSCTKDDIPTTPPPPFLFTDLAVSKFVSPAATVALKANTVQKVRFDINYTLSASDDSRRSTLGLFAIVMSTDANFGNANTVGSVASVSPPLKAPSGVLSDSITFNVPAGVAYIQIEAAVIYTPLDTIVAVRDGPYWSVK